ncbi:COPII subunit [Teratosphaeriaceae sp. CCFEE 6253]|nr:COPII subunit [Teratosphaeriaceae sp. CCFEE 6253]
MEVRPNTHGLRSAALQLFSTLPLSLPTQFNYPRFYSRHDMADDAGEPEVAVGAIVVPAAQDLSSGNIVAIWLVVARSRADPVLMAGRDAVPALIADVFGTDDKNPLNQGKTTLPLLDPDMNERVRAVVEKTADYRCLRVGSIARPPMFL